jgi:hypothetical protein
MDELDIAWAGMRRSARRMGAALERLGEGIAAHIQSTQRGDAMSTRDFPAVLVRIDTDKGVIYIDNEERTVIRISGLPTPVLLPGTGDSGMLEMVAPILMNWDGESPPQRTAALTRAAVLGVPDNAVQTLTEMELGRLRRLVKDQLKEHALATGRGDGRAVEKDVDVLRSIKEKLS